MKAYASRIPAVLMGVIIAASVLAVLIANVVAQEDQGGSGSGLSISPTRTELRIEPGTTQEIELNLRNVTRGAIVAKPFISDFESDDATGEPRLYLNDEKRNSASINSFVSGLVDVPLSPGEDKNLKYTISVPNDATAGGYYGAIAYRAVPADQANLESGQVSLTANVASLVLIEVPGDITEQIRVTSVKAQKEDKDKKFKSGSFFTSAPSHAAIAVRNEGTSFSKPFGTIRVTNMSGKEVYSYEINNSTPRSNVLPKTSRTFTDKIENVNKPGRYTITTNISHGTGGEVIVQKVSFWYLPVWLLIAVAVLVLGIAGGIYMLYRKKFKK